MLTRESPQYGLDIPAGCKIIPLDRLLQVQHRPITARMMRRNWPNGLPITASALDRASACGLNLESVAALLLSAEAMAQFKQVRDPAWALHLAAFASVDPVTRETHSLMEPHWEAYLQAIITALLPLLEAAHVREDWGAGTRLPGQRNLHAGQFASGRP